MTKTSARKRKTERKPRQASSSEACKRYLGKVAERDRQSVNPKNTKTINEKRKRVKD